MGRHNDNPSRINQRLMAGVATEMEPAPASGPWPTEVLLFTQIPLAEGRALQREASERMHAGTAPGQRLVLTEHPPTRASPGDPDRHFVPGMLVAHLTLHLDHWHGNAEACAAAAGETLLRVLREFGVEARLAADDDSLTIDGRAIAAFDVRADGPVAFCTLVIHTNTDVETLADLRKRDGEPLAVTTMIEQGMAIERQHDVRTVLLRHYEQIFRSKPHLAQRGAHRTVKPPWLRAKLPVSVHTRRVHQIIDRQRLNTVCESARCPNQGECWSHGTATFMINGSVCTRSCSFCAIFTGRPQPIDAEEPHRVAEAAAAMGLNYVVVTAVNRDELEDGGAEQFVQTIEELRQAIPGVKVEVLIPDFKGDDAALDAVFAARPDVLNHNMETVRRLYPRVRPQARYDRSLNVLQRSKQAGLVTKSGFMLGLGEEHEEIAELLRDQHAHGCDIVTIGQYLRPSDKHHSVVRFVTPSEFDGWRDWGLRLGFRAVQSGPLVRSSYHAHESFDLHQTAAATSGATGGN